MKSQVTDDFLACFGRLPDEVKALARKCYRLWRDDPSHPSLRFKPIKGQDSLYSVRVGRGWRSLGFLEGDRMTWFWIGSHAEYDRIIGTMD